MPRHFEQATAGQLTSAMIGKEVVVYGSGGQWSIRGTLHRVDQHKVLEAEFSTLDGPKDFTGGFWRTSIYLQGYVPVVDVNYTDIVYLVSSEIDPEEPIQGEIVGEQPEIGS